MGDTPHPRLRGSPLRTPRYCRWLNTGYGGPIRLLYHPTNIKIGGWSNHRWFDPSAGRPLGLLDIAQIGHQQLEGQVLVKLPLLHS